MTAPLAAGDPVVAPALGVRGTIVEIEGDEAEVHGRAACASGSRSRGSSRDPRGRRGRGGPRRPCTVRTTAPADVASELDVRGQRGRRGARGGARVRRRRLPGGAQRGARDPRARHGRRAQGGARRARAAPLVAGAVAGGRATARRWCALCVAVRAEAPAPVENGSCAARSSSPSLPPRLRSPSRAVEAAATATPPRRRPPRRRPAAATRRRARKLFASAGCSGCHTFSAAGSSGSVGPNLDDASPSYDHVVTQVTEGGGAMPSFKDDLTEQQIQDVAAFVSGS